MSEVSDQDQQELANEWASALEDQENPAGKAAARQPVTNDVFASGQSNPSAPPHPERAQFQSLTDEGGDAGEMDKNLDMILDIPVNLSVEIGRTRISIRNLLKLNQGSVVELTRVAGEPMDIFVNGTLIAHGEVVVVNEKFGIRLTDVISAAERVKKLK